jgi:hypothetical protein
MTTSSRVLVTLLMLQYELFKWLVSIFSCGCPVRASLGAALAAAAAGFESSAI